MTAAPATVARSPAFALLARVLELTPAHLEGLTRIITATEQVKKRHDLVVQGTACRRLYFVADGYGVRYRLLHSGKRQILNVILPGDVIGFPISLFDRANYSVVALTSLTYSACTLDDYVRLCYEQPEFGLVLTWLAAHEASIYAEHIVDLGRRTPLERLAHFLLEIHGRLLLVGRAEGNSFELPFSQEVMADVLGLSVPHLNRTMQALRGERLIVCRARTVEFADVTGLRRLAQFQPVDLIPIPAPARVATSGP